MVNHDDSVYLSGFIVAFLYFFLHISRPRETLIDVLLLIIPGFCIILGCVVVYLLKTRQECKPTVDVTVEVI